MHYYAGMDDDTGAMSGCFVWAAIGELHAGMYQRAGLISAVMPLFKEIKLGESSILKLKVGRRGRAILNSSHN